MICDDGLSRCTGFTAFFRGFSDQLFHSAHWAGLVSTVWEDGLSCFTGLRDVVAPPQNEKQRPRPLGYDMYGIPASGARGRVGAVLPSADKRLRPDRSRLTHVARIQYCDHDMARSYRGEAKWLCHQSRRLGRKGGGATKPPTRAQNSSRRGTD